MKYELVFLVALIASPVLAEPGDIVNYAGRTPIAGHGSEWLDADGSCVADAEFRALSEALHDGNNWPFGRCDSEHFRLPNLLGQMNDGKTGALIRTR